MIQVSIPASVPLKEFDYNAEVELINPVADTVQRLSFSRARGGLVHQGGGYCPEKRGCHESAAAEERRSPCKITGT